jgi:hypothetical protein
MIREITVKNFYSFKEKNKISFLVNKKVPCTDAYVDSINKDRLTKILACFGSNASGKTNLLKIIPFISWFINDSFNLKPDEKIPFSKFLFEKNNQEPAEISICFDHLKKIYRYSISMNECQIINEALHVYESKSFKYLFKRTWNESRNQYSFLAQNYGQTKSFTESVKKRKNASVFSIALQYEHEESKSITAYFLNINSNVQKNDKSIAGSKDLGILTLFDSAKYFNKNPDYMNYTQRILSKFDLGLSAIETIDISKASDHEGAEKSDESKVYLPFGIHIGKDKSEHKLPFFRESHGTQHLYVFLCRIQPILEQGGIAIIDELEDDLHPHIIRSLIDLFISRKSNPKNAQLLFSSHSIEIMKYLDKYQVLLVEKDEYGCSKILRLDEIKGVRSDDNIYAKYDSGAYGAIPNI